VSTTPNPFDQLRARHRPEAKEFLRQNPEIRDKLLTPESDSTSKQDGHEQSNGSKWPAPLASQAFQGIAGTIVRAIEPHTEADPAALLIQFLTGFGNLIGRGAYTTVEADRHGCNLFAAIVGVSAKGRKGTSWGHIRRVLENVDAAWAKERIQGGLSSGEGLVWGVRDPTEKQEALRDGKQISGYQTVQVDAGVSDKRLLIVESELASALRVMGREGSTLSPLMRQAWDTGDLRVLTKNSPAKATGAHISTIGHITRDELLRFLTSTETANGFANRFLWVCAKRSKLLPEGGHIHEVDFSLINQHLTNGVTAGQNAGEIPRDETARKIWREVYPALSEGKMGMFGCATGRAEAQVLRLALVYAVLDRARAIAAEHLLAALAIWDFCEASARYIFGDALGNPVADRILQALRAAPGGLTRTEIRDLFERNRSASEINVALTALEERGLAQRVSEVTAGRPIERWIAANGVTTKTT
jgi:Protein of unknown function (DUF3987)